MKPSRCAIAGANDDDAEFQPGRVLHVVIETVECQARQFHGRRVEWEATLSGGNLPNSDAYTNLRQDGFGILVGFLETPRRYMGKF
jgi:hypothetical protein